MGMGFHRGLVNILSARSFDRSTGRDVAMKVDRVVRFGCRRLGRWASRDRWLVIWTKGRGTCWFGKGDGPRGCTASILIWSSNKLVSLANRSFISQMCAQILPGCSLWHRFGLLIGLLYFFTFGNKFGIKYFTWCFVWCMHDTRNIEWYVMLKNA